MAEGFDYFGDAGAVGIRRIGSRQPVGLAVRWRPADQAGERRPRGRRRAPVEVREAILEDVSVSGGRILLPTDQGMVRNARLEVELGGAWAAARIVRVTPTNDPTKQWCGITFVLPDESFMAVVANLTHRAHLSPPRD